MTDHDEKLRKSWKKGSRVEIYSESKQKWFKGHIERIFTDSEGEWLTVKYGGFNVKEVQRWTEFIRPVPRKKGKQTKKIVRGDTLSNSSTKNSQKMKEITNGVSGDLDDSKAISIDTPNSPMSPQRVDEQSLPTIKVSNGHCNDDRKEMNSSTPTLDRNDSTMDSADSTQDALNKDHHISTALKMEESPNGTLSISDPDRGTLAEFEALEIRQYRLIEALHSMQSEMESMARSKGVSLEMVHWMDSDDVTMENVMDSVDHSISSLLDIAEDIKLTAAQYKVDLPETQNVWSLISSLKSKGQNVDSENLELGQPQNAVISKVKKRGIESIDGDEQSREEQKATSILRRAEMVVPECGKKQIREKAKKKVDPLLSRMDDALRMVNDALQQHKAAVDDFLSADVKSLNELLTEVKEQFAPL